VRIPATPGGLLPDGEFAKTADENVVAIGEGGLDKFEDGFKETSAIESGNAKAALKGTYNVVFGESHGRQPPEPRFIWKKPIPCSTT
jgi:hypothetical protein